MIKGIGVDIIEIARIREAVERYGDKFLSRVYAPAEIAYCKHLEKLKYPELAVRFAAKEAYAKALGTGIRGQLSKREAVGLPADLSAVAVAKVEARSAKAGPVWQAIEVANDKLGKPYFKNAPKKAHLSLSHCQKYATAFVVIENV